MLNIILTLILLIIVATILLLYYYEHQGITGANERVELLSVFDAKEFQKFVSEIIQMDNLAPKILLDDIKYEIKYKENKRIFKPSVHIGQRKLFGNELQFLTNHLSSKFDEAIVVYAGSSPCNSLYFIRELFPNVKFLLVDPNETLICVKHRVSHYSKDTGDIIYARSSHSNKYLAGTDKKITYYNNGIPLRIDRKDATEGIVSKNFFKFMKDTKKYKIFVIEDLFTIGLAKLIAKCLGNVYFWSDIRSNSKNMCPTDLDIIWNSAQQYNWVKIMKPKRFMLKFRMPFFNLSPSELKKITKKEPYASDIKACKNDIDFVKNYPKKEFIYIKGDIYIQPYANISSTETRLVGKIKDGLLKYDVNKYDNKFFYYNSIERTIGLHKNANADESLGYDFCGDCSLENSILEEYKKKMDNNFDIIQAIKRLQIITNRPLLNCAHGTLFDKMTREKYEGLRQKFGYR